MQYIIQIQTHHETFKHHQFSQSNDDDITVSYYHTYIL